MQPIAAPAVTTVINGQTILGNGLSSSQLKVKSSNNASYSLSDINSNISEVSENEYSDSLLNVSRNDLGALNYHMLVHWVNI